MKLKIVLSMLVAVSFVGGVQAVFAAGPHDENCVECHSIHYAKGDFITGAEPNMKIDNPSSQGKADGIEALCLGCHNKDQGIMPIHLSTTHPTGIAPSYVNVPEKLLRDGKFSCVSCHNPHPSNNNYKYLVVDTEKGSKIGKFCAVCHSEQANEETRKSSQSAIISGGPQVTPRVKVKLQAKVAKK